MSAVGMDCSSKPRRLRKCFSLNPILQPASPVELRPKDLKRGSPPAPDSMAFLTMAARARQAKAIVVCTQPLGPANHSPGAPR